MSLITFDMELCSKCGACASECPVKIIEMAKGGPVVVAERASTCILCGHCVCVCPVSALTHEEFSPEECPMAGEAPSEQEAERIIRRRRSIRSYKKKPVEREAVERLIHIARYGPTASNAQSVGWIVVANREGVTEVSDIVISWMRKLVRWRHPASKKPYDMKLFIMAYEAGMDVICREAPALVFNYTPKASPMGLTDSAIAMTSLDIAAPSLGLGTCWAGFVMAAASHHKPLVRHLGVPAGNVLTGAMMVGYPKFGYLRMPGRKEPNIVWK